MSTPSKAIHTKKTSPTDTLVVAHAIDFTTSTTLNIPRRVRRVSEVKGESRDRIISKLGDSGNMIGPKESVLLFSDNGGLVKGELPKDPGRYTAIVPACVDRVDPLIGTSLPANVAAFQPETLATIFSTPSTIQAQMDNFKEMFMKELNDQKKSSGQQQEWFSKQLDKEKELFDKEKELLKKQKESSDKQIAKLEGDILVLQEQSLKLQEQSLKLQEQGLKLQEQGLRFQEQVLKLQETNGQLSDRIQILEKEKEGFHTISDSALEWTTVRDTFDADRIRIRALIDHAQARLACLEQLSDEASPTTLRAKLWRNLLFSLPETERMQRTRNTIGPDPPDSVVVELANPASSLREAGDQAAHPHIDRAHYTTIYPPLIRRASVEIQPLLTGLVAFLNK